MAIKKKLGKISEKKKHFSLKKILMWMKYWIGKKKIVGVFNRKKNWPKGWVYRMRIESWHAFNQII